MRLKYDLNVRALYIRLSDRTVARTRQIDDNTAIDLDAAGVVVGIEVISVDHPWPLSEILANYKLPAGEEAKIRAYFQPPQSAAIRGSLPDAPQEAPALSVKPISVAA